MPAASARTPELFAGLVHACRYCGLIDASIAAYEKASRLDPNISTSVCHSCWFAGDMERALATDNGETPFMKLLARIRRGEIDQVIGERQELAAVKPSVYSRGWMEFVATSGSHESFAMPRHNTVRPPLRSFGAGGDRLLGGLGVN